MNEKTSIEETRNEFKWEFKKLRNFLYEIDGDIYCIGGWVCKKSNNDNEKYNRFKLLAKETDFENVKSYEDIKNYKEIFKLYDDIINENQHISGDEDLNIVCEKLFNNVDLFKEFKKQKKIFDVLNENYKMV